MRRSICSFYVSKANRTVPSALDAAKDIVRRLGYHPLAFTQAASYISKQKLPLNTFVEYYESRRRIILETTPAVINYRRKLHGHDKEIALTVFTTWELLFQQLREQTKTGENGVEVKLLILLAFFNNQDVSELLVRECFCREYNQISAVTQELISWTNYFRRGGDWDTHAYQDTVVNLAKLSLVQTWTRSEIDKLVHVTMHPLIKDWIRLRTSSDDFELNTALAWLSCGFVIRAGDWDLQLGFEWSAATRYEVFQHEQTLLADERGLLLDRGRAYPALALSLHQAYHYCGRLLYEFGFPELAEKPSREAVVFSRLAVAGIYKWFSLRFESIV